MNKFATKVMDIFNKKKKILKNPFKYSEIKNIVLLLNDSKQVASEPIKLLLRDFRKQNIYYLINSEQDNLGTFDTLFINRYTYNWAGQLKDAQLNTLIDKKIELFVDFTDHKDENILRFLKTLNIDMLVSCDSEIGADLLLDNTLKNNNLDFVQEIFKYIKLYQ